MSKPAIEVSSVSKKLTRGLRQAMWNATRAVAREAVGLCDTRFELRRGEFLALNDISFSVMPGECLALLGHNGAGKSTLLKLLNGIIRPDAGVIRMRGRVGALIEVGAGFHPMLTGRENIFVNGAVLGMSQRAIQSRFDDIVEFSGLSGASLDQPVKTYSSGMYVRLGFSIAVHASPDVLLIDEVLSVGDPGFIERAQRRLEHMLSNGAAFVFVSHHLEQVERLCGRALLLEQGSIRVAGPAPIVTAEFREHCRVFVEGGAPN